jgi:hypothetical protein
MAVVEAGVKRKKYGESETAAVRGVSDRKVRES